VAAAAATLGDNICFWISHTGGYRVPRRYGHYLRIDETRPKSAGTSSTATAAKSGLGLGFLLDGIATQLPPARQASPASILTTTIDGLG
jgi:hypothetical protein